MLHEFLHNQVTIQNFSPFLQPNVPCLQATPPSVSARSSKVALAKSHKSILRSFSASVKEFAATNIKLSSPSQYQRHTLDGSNVTHPSAPPADSTSLSTPSVPPAMVTNKRTPVRTSCPTNQINHPRVMAYGGNFLLSFFYVVHSMLFLTVINVRFLCIRQTVEQAE